MASVLNNLFGGGKPAASPDSTQAAGDSGKHSDP
jgi:hypothetical protein